ncbi:roadblock/LC7 domain-containing protein [Thermoactinospora rubra]|uniref:roadblock/LC7 domain-containing protein n=1 Tax=Thermoactinospora rubra TaxID=1088767 RepID=UPI000A11D058|nr:roadblock/LC7 domain-containing protein [Thermoactinospora rubra]
METREDVLKELIRLRERTPGIAGSLACTVDGFIVACEPEWDTAEQMAALSSALLSLSRRMLTLSSKGALEETVVSGSAGLAAFYAAGPTIVLAVVAEPGANLGLLRLEGRKTAANLAAIASHTGGK